MTEIKNVTVVGGTGNLGRKIVSTLLAANLNVTILSRATTTPPAELSPDIKFLTADFTSISSLAAALKQASTDAVVSAVGIAGVPGQTLLIEAALAAGVARFVPSEFANAPVTMRRAGAGEGLAELAYAREPKSAIMEYLIRRCDESGGAMSWSAVATGNFFDYALRKFPNGMGFNVKERTAVLIDSGAEPFTGTTLAGIADSVLGILLHPQETCNKYLRVRSVETTQAEILRAFEDVTGVKWKVEHQNGQELLDRARGKLERGEGATLDLVRVQLFMEGAGRSVLVRRGEGDNELLGVKEEDVTEVVRAVVADVELLRVKEEDVMEAMRAVVADAEAAQAD